MEIQRSRLIASAASAIEELGFAQATVAQITARARVSRRTFYEMFAHREECLAAVLADAEAMVAAELAAADIGRLPWHERVRMGLWTILAFLDREPVLARVCVVQALRADPTHVRRREEIIAQFVAVVDEGRREGTRRGECTELTAEGLVGAAFAVVYTRLLRAEHEPLVGLLGELMGMIVLPYLGPAAARREQSRLVSVSPAPAREPSGTQRGAMDPFEGLQMRLTYRTARVLEGIAERPGASNRMIADAAGISDQGQVSKLLRRLQQLDLLTNLGEGRAKGESNAWALTSKGERVAQSIRTHSHRERAAA